MLGKQIANFRVEEKLGEGGMGVVYRAIDLDLDRMVAIKVLAADLSQDPALLERFRAEAKAQANLGHANIAALYTLLNVDGHVSIVMEYLEGETLYQIIQRRGLIPWEEAVPWFKQALLGIGFAHRRGIIHRDIKPSNIMVNRYGTVKVMDFGIAKVIGGQRLTKTGTNVGTVGYMSPEQVRNEPVDVRSDIYCLGVTLYEMLTAHLPFESNSEFQVMSDHVHTPPPAPTRHYPYIPPGIEQAVLKALAKNPDERFQSVEEFGAALEHPEGAKGPSGTVVYPTGPGVIPAAAVPAVSATPAPLLNSAPALATSAFAAAPAPPIQHPVPAAPAVAGPVAGSKNKKALLGGGALAALLLIGVGAFALRPKPVPVTPARLGGGGEIVGSALPPAQSGGAAPQTPAQQDAAAVPVDKGAPAVNQSIMDSLATTPAGGKGTGATLSSGSVVRAGRVSGTAAKAARGGQSSGQGQAQAPPGAQAPAPAPAPPQAQAAAGPSDAELSSASDDLIKIRARMDAVHQSLATLRQEQAAQGLGLRGDIAASESRLYSYYEVADRALQQRNLTSAQRSMDQAEQELTKLEHFLGR